MKTFDFKGAKRSLDPEQEKALVEDLSARLFLTSTAVQAHIRAWFGVEFSRSGLIKYLNRLGFECRKPKALPARADVAAQAAFIAAYERLLNDLGGDEVVYFADAVHPEYQSRPARGWIRRGDKVAVKRTTGRKRLNLHVALCLDDFDRQITHNKYYPSETEFIMAIFAFFKQTLPNQWQSIRYTVSDNFHVIQLSIFRVVG